jgi:hypothetical protein
VSASKEIHSFSGIVRKTVETRVSINAAMIPTQKSAFASSGKFSLARLPTLDTSAGDGHRFPNPPPVPLTVLRGDGQANDPSLTLTNHTTPGHIPAHQHPFEPLRANRIRGAGWVVHCIRSVCARPLMGGQAAPPPRGGLGRCSRLRPAPYGGPGYPAPTWGAGAMFAPVSLRARPLTGGQAAPPPCGGLGRRSRAVSRLASPAAGSRRRPQPRLRRQRRPA